MKKITTLFVAGAFVFGAAVPTFAQTATTATTADLGTLIANLQSQIADLQAKIAALRGAQQAVAGVNADVQETLRLLAGLRQGMTGDQIARVQAILAADASVYPEGLITGYYGPLTARAIEKFREKYEKRQEKFDERMKEVSEKMRGKIAKMEEKHENKMGNMERKFAKKLCNIPQGLLIAPGYQKTHQDEWARLWREWRLCTSGGGNGTTTPDTAPPIISSLTVSHITNTSAVIRWNTNENATNKIYFSTVAPVNLATAMTAQTSSSTTVHEINLSGLAASTTYYYIAESKDAAGNTATSSPGSFTTSAAPVSDTVAPVISSLIATNIGSTTASIGWSTNENATGKVFYSTTTPVNVATASLVSENTLALSHSFNITGLPASTTHHYIAVSTDASGNTVTSSEQSFLTLP